MTRETSKNRLLGGLAAASLTVVAWTACSARLAERQHPPVGQFVDVDGVRLHYLDQGDRPVVVLLHGNLVTLQDFIACGLIERLAKRYRVIAFDRPGFGYSERPRTRIWTPHAQAKILQDALARFAVGEAMVVGQSLGCLVATAMALDPRMDIRGLTLISGYYYPTPRVDVAITAPAAVPMVGDIVRYTVSPILARLTYRRTLRAMFSPWGVPERFQELTPRAFVLRPSQMRAVAEDAACMIPAANAMSSRYKELGMPVRIFAGDDDLIVDAHSQSARLGQDIAQSTLTVLPHAGHMLYYDNCRVADAIESLSYDASRNKGVREATRKSALTLWECRNKVI